MLVTRLHDRVLTKASQSISTKKACDIVQASVKVVKHPSGQSDHPHVLTYTYIQIET